MNYCENCYVAAAGECCPVCGNKRLREVRDDDFCLVAENNESYCNSIANIFESENIPYQSMPYGNGMRSRAGLPLSNYRLYVPFRFLERAQAAMKESENTETEELRRYLLGHADLYNISEKAEKKIFKKLKLPPGTDFNGYVKSLVQAANRIVDEGSITLCPKFGHYLFCYSNGSTVAINSQTFEILSVTAEKQ